jgi:2,3-bisphosphoglycerate-independent phosphoglycerate mutase
VPLVLVNGPASVRALDAGRLADVAPTVLALMGLPQPAAMSGRSLLLGGAEKPKAASDDELGRRAAG